MFNQIPFRGCPDCCLLPLAFHDNTAHSQHWGASCLLLWDQTIPDGRREQGPRMSAHLPSNTTCSSMLPMEPKCCGHSFAVPECFISDSCVLPFNCKFFEVRQPISVYLPPAYAFRFLRIRTWPPQSGFILQTQFLCLVLLRTAHLHTQLSLCFLLFIRLLLVSPRHPPIPVRKVIPLCSLLNTEPRNT